MPGFHNLDGARHPLGVRRRTWRQCRRTPAVPTMTTIAKDAPAFDYVDAKVPFYPAERVGARKQSR